MQDKNSILVDSYSCCLDLMKIINKSMNDNLSVINNSTNDDLSDGGETMWF